MTAHALSQLGMSLAAATGPVADTVATAVDSPALGHTFAYLIAISAVLTIGALLFFWRWRARPRRDDPLASRVGR
jgi:hypothetical protein